MKILITGVAGLIGSRFCRWLFEHTEHTVVGVDDLSCGMISNLHPAIESLYVLPVGRGQLDHIFARHKPDLVYHFAAHAAECLSPFVRCENYQNNLVATAEVVNCCITHGVRRLVYTSSMAVYGRNAVLPFDEDMPLAPIDPYGVAKMASELDIRIAGDQHSLDWCIIRPHNVYGPGQVFLQPHRNVLSLWLHRHMQGLPLLIYGDGCQRRAFSYVDDCMYPLYMAGTARSASRQVFNLGGTKPVTINQAAAACLSVIPKAVIEHCEPRHEVRDAWSTWRRSEAVLGYREEWSLERGIAELWDWMKAVRHVNRPLPVSFELRQGLYSYWAHTPELEKS